MISLHIVTALIQCVLLAWALTQGPAVPAWATAANSTFVLWNLYLLPGGIP